MQWLPPSAWPRSAAWLRVVLATGTPVSAYFLLPGGFQPLLYGVMALYLGYAVVAALRGGGHTGVLGLLSLLGDTVFFVVLASFGTGHMLWLASAFYLFLMGEALAFHSTVEVVVIAALCTVFGAVLPYNAFELERTVIVGGILAGVFAANKHGQGAENERLRETARLAE